MWRRKCRDWCEKGAVDALKLGRIRSVVLPPHKLILDRGSVTASPRLNDRWPGQPALRGLNLGSRSRVEVAIMSGRVKLALNGRLGEVIQTKTLATQKIGAATRMPNSNGVGARKMIPS